MKYSSTLWLAVFFFALLGAVAAPGAVSQDTAPRLAQIEARLAQLEAVQHQHGGGATTHSASPRTPALAGGSTGGAMGGVDQGDVEACIRALLPDYMAMGRNGIAERREHTDSGHMRDPDNALPMMDGKGPFGNLDMGGMFTVLKVRDDLAPGDYRDPGDFAHPPGTVARRISADPEFGAPLRKADLG